MPVITIPKALRDRLGDEGSDALVDLMNAVIDQTRTDTWALIGERFERRLTEEFSKVNERFTSLEQTFERRLAEEIAKVHERITQETAKLRQEIAELKADLIRWMFIFWAGQLVAILGILLAFFRK